MEGPGGSLSGGVVDLQRSLRVHHRQQPLHRQGSSSVLPPIQECLSLGRGTMHESIQTVSLVDFYKGDRGSDEEDEPSTYNEDGADGEKKWLIWKRVKWTGKMVRLLITAASYVGDGVVYLQKKGKWKAISKVMEERGFHVSPQQCEDKFNDLNKRYKNLNEILGRGTACQVVENPHLLSVIDYLTESEKDDVRKKLSSEHLFFVEMCSYHNGNRLHLPHDRALQKSLQLALLRSRDDLDEDDHDEFENYVTHGERNGAKWVRQGQRNEDVCFEDAYRGVYPDLQIGKVDMNESSRAALLMQKQQMESRTLQLEEQKLHIEVGMLELEKQRFKWQRVSRNRERKLEKMRVENGRMKVENERIALEMKRKDTTAIIIESE